MVDLDNQRIYLEQSMQQEKAAVPTHGNLSENGLPSVPNALSWNMFDSTGKPPRSEKDALTHDDAVPGRGETPDEVTPKVVSGKNGPYLNEKSFNTPPSALIIFSSSSLEIFEIVIWFCCGVAVIAITGSLICPKEYVFSANELRSHSFTGKSNNMLVAIPEECVIEDAIIEEVLWVKLLRKSDLRQEMDTD
ncbi:hypothetical protein MJO29_000991 [Puccinia striiformis f. sp. tritici]|nr:hypothetical protein MJO29_000991 [Puccinia striiformis f. sp. tritici]